MYSHQAISNPTVIVVVQGSRVHVCVIKSNYVHGSTGLAACIPHDTTKAPVRKRARGEMIVTNLSARIPICTIAMSSPLEATRSGK